MAKNDKIKDDEKDQKVMGLQNDPASQRRQVRFIEEGVKTQYRAFLILASARGAMGSILHY